LDLLFITFRLPAIASSSEAGEDDEEQSAFGGENRHLSLVRLFVFGDILDVDFCFIVVCTGYKDLGFFVFCLWLIAQFPHD